VLGPGHTQGPKAYSRGVAAHFVAIATAAGLLTACTSPTPPASSDPPQGASPAAARTAAASQTATPTTDEPAAQSGTKFWPDGEPMDRPGDVWGVSCLSWVITDLKVMPPEHKPDGSPWDDDGSPPDLQIVISMNGEETTIAGGEGIEAEAILTPELPVAAFTPMVIEVRDLDSKGYEVLGRYDFDLRNRVSGWAWTYTKQGEGKMHGSVRCVEAADEPKPERP
jgi:hypothetical protein